MYTILTICNLVFVETFGREGGGFGGKGEEGLDGSAAIGHTYTNTDNQTRATKRRRRQMGCHVRFLHHHPQPGFCVSRYQAALPASGGKLEFWFRRSLAMVL